LERTVLSRDTPMAVSSQLVSIPKTNMKIV
jgi:hypothetical protein